MVSRTVALGGALRRRLGPAGRELFRAARAPTAPRGSVSGRIDSLSDEAPRRGIRFEVVYPGETISRRPARTVAEPLPEVFTQLATYRQPDAFRALVPESRIAGEEPVVMTADGEVLLESTFDLYQLERNPVLSERLARPRRLRGTHACLVNQWSSVYFHWVLDTLPRASLLPLAEQPELPVIVPGRLASFQRESLDGIGVPAERRVPYDGSQYIVDELWFPSLPRTGNPPRWAIEWLRSRFAPPPAEPPARRLYVSRADAPARRVENEREVVALLAEHGFEVVLGSDLSFAQQMRVFSEASVIVGPHGGALVNALAARDATLIEFMEPRYVNGCYYALADAAGLDYWLLMAEPAGETGLHVDVSRLAATLEAAL